MLVVLGEHTTVTATKAEARYLLPVVHEPAHCGEGRGGAAVAHEHAECATRFHRGELRPIADEDELRAGFCNCGRDAVQGERARERSLVQQDELTRP